MQRDSPPPPPGWGGIPHRPGVLKNRPHVASRINIRGYRAGFLFVVALFVGVMVFTLVTELRSNEKVDDLVTQGLERDRLIALIRVDVLLLKDAVDEHIKAATDEERTDADEEMAFIIDEISQSSDQ